MTDKKDDTGRGPARYGEGPRRPYATIDLEATEVGARQGAAPAAASAKPEASSAPPHPSAGDRPGGARTAFARGLAAAGRWGGAALQSNTFLSHVGAGVAGAVLTLVAAALFGLFAARGGPQQPAADVAKRLAAIEQAMRGLQAGPGDLKARLAQADARIAGLESRARDVAALSDAQAKLAAQTKALEDRVASPQLAGRLAKLETALAALSASDQSGRTAQADALAAKLSQLEQMAEDAAAAVKSGTARAQSDVAALRTAAARLGQRIDALKGEIDERFKGAAKAAELAPVMSKLATFERDLQAFLRGESERSANARRVLLTLEMASLKRAMDRGERYAAELEAVKKAAGGTLQLRALERHGLEGVRTLPELTKEFRRVADAAIDAEADPADASVLDRLIAGARGIVRVRKTGHAPEDMSAEAVVGRMEAALKDGRLGEVLAHGKTLPPKAALAAEDWLQKVAARHSVDRAMADIEAQLKSSLGEGGVEQKR
jgi:hypothetical protein